ncbi:hypothetical protein [Streptomyces sp. NPDC047315]|uniref:DUF7848 domain-containing protein n=1 Tax=Streptomyces sp. NPDC047315 TaxID=3155142 RepID=UPI00340EB360
MTSRRLFAFASLRLDPDEDAAAPAYAMTCECGETSGPMEQQVDADLWALTHTGQQPTHRRYCGTLVRAFRVVPVPGSLLHQIENGAGGDVAAVVDLNAACSRCGTSRGVALVATLPTGSGPDRPVYGCPEHAKELADAAEDTLLGTEALARLNRLGADRG